ncbi:MAG: sulfatase-like hydrolase/transferase [Verrucomicrobiales bacterium]|nr:sulfatase-like hydrolase/transferase [Verrucomicrobiales bacterium]
MLIRKNHSSQQNMKRFLFLLILTVCPAAYTAEDKTNFIVFLTDDMGWGDLACYGHPVIQTPNLDKFAKEGVRFTQAYSSCGVCSPSRSSILTGRTPYRNGVWRWIPGGHQTHLRESEITLPELLKPLGYETMHTGKWHLNGHFNSPEQPQPNDHGYDWWFATQNNAAPSHKNPVNFARNGEEVGPLEGFSAPLVCEEAINWLSDERDPEKPFFITVWTHEPHLPIESDPKFMKLYSELEDADHRQHHGNITQIDYAFGKLMEALDAQGLRENTFVIFTSDNGPEGRSERGRTRGSTGGLRGRKRDSHEGGIRVPAIARWPGKIEPGTVSNTPIIGSDIFSTVLDIVDVPQPDDRTIDGVSMIPAFAGKELERPVPLFWRTHIAPDASHAAMRIDEWKIVANKDLTKFQLYQIEEDWKEENDLAAGKPEKLAAMKAKFLEVWKDIEAEGPKEWWENEPERKRGPGKKKAGGKLKAGTDKSGDWDVVKGGTVEKSDFGYLLDAGSGEAIALKKLDTPIQESATFSLSYRAAKGTGVTKNACFCFGSATENDALFKAGTMIGMNRHGFFEGGWANVGIGAGKKAKFDHDATFEAQVTIDLEHGKAILKIGENKVEQKLPDTLESVTHFGIYAKATRSEFTMPGSAQP